MKRMIFLIFIMITAFYSQNLQPPVSGDITSDYGPRNYNGYDWHQGIDYASPMWNPVEAVEGGNIVYIRAYNNPANEAGWRIRIHTNSEIYWTYMHLFDNLDNPLSPDNRYEAMKAILENPNNPGDTLHRYIFIFWDDRENNRAQKVLASRSGRYVRWGNDYIRNQNGEPILTRGTVEERERSFPGNDDFYFVGFNSKINKQGYKIMIARAEKNFYQIQLCIKFLFDMKNLKILKFS